MPREDAFERALNHFTQTVLPNLQDITSIFSDPAHPLRTATTPFLTLLLLNCLFFFTIAILARLAWRLVDATISLLGSAFVATLSLGKRLIRRARGMPEASSNSYSSHADQGPEGAHETTGEEFTSWEDFAKESSHESSPRTHDEEILHAFTILGIKAHANEADVRRAYLALMKKYHPDLYMKAPADEQERVRQAALKVRHAYDLLSKELQ